VGDAVDSAHCVFCTAVFSAQPQRVRMHFAFVGEARHPALGVSVCAGPTRGDAESEEEFAARRT
jgi:hypothetical protein